MSEDYTGLAALAWEGYAADPNPDIHKDKPMWLEAARTQGNPILDVGCGTGRILIPLLEAGFDADGIDPSEDALTICRRKLDERGLTATLTCGTMQTLATPRRYRTIIVPCGTIQLILERAEQRESLNRLFSHLLPGGALLLTLYNYGAGYSESDRGVWKTRSRRMDADGNEIEKSAIIHSWNLMDQTLRQQTRYRRIRGDAILEEQTCEADERWFYAHEMSLMLERAGFEIERITGDYMDAPAVETNEVFTFWARKPKRIAESR